MSVKLNKKKRQAAVVIALVVSTLVGSLFYSGAVDRLEWIAPDPRVEVVLIDEASLQAMDPLVGRWPWPRSVYADIIDFFTIGGARAVAFDILFPERETRGEEVANGYSANDQSFIDATATAGNIYHAMQVMREVDTREHNGMLNRPMPVAFIKQHALPQTSGFPDYGNNDYLLPIDGLAQAAAGVGIVEVEPDADGVYRRIRPFSVYQGNVFTTLGIAPLLPELDVGTIRFEGDGIALNGTMTLPLDDNGYFLINMLGQFKPYSISGILASVQKLHAGEVANLLVDPYEFEGKIVFIGASAIGVQDIKATPMSAKTPGVFLHASLASNLLQHQFLHPVSRHLSLALLIGFALLVAFGTLSFSQSYQQSLVPLLLAAAYTGWSMWEFGNGRVYDMTAPLLAIALSWLGSSAYLAFTEGKDKRRVRNMLSQYVSPAVLAEVVDKYENQIQAEVGTRENLTILFSDIRSFTAISETTTAEKVVEMLNTYFSAMSEVIFRYEGTLDKFIGDAIMAFWGAPIRLEDHADRGVKAAIEMQRALLKVNEELSTMGLPSVVIGVGLNSGEVILGNIGSARKLDYTIIGDNVNLASRLEGLTKLYGTPIIISEHTHEQLHRPVPCAVVDLVQVKGKQIPIRLYWPLALPDDDAATVKAAQGVAELSEKAFNAYLGQEWDEAIALYEQVPSEKLRDIFIARCSEFKQNPPGEGWDGVYTMTTK